MPTYQNKFSKGDEFMLNGRFHKVHAVRKEGGECEYQLSKRGNLTWVDAPLVDRDATEYNGIRDDGKVS